MLPYYLSSFNNYSSLPKVQKSLYVITLSVNSAANVFRSVAANLSRFKGLKLKPY